MRRAAAASRHSAAASCPGPGLSRRLEHPFDSHPPTYQRIADLSLALDDDLLRQARRIVSADDTQWLNRLLDAGHGESR